MGSEDFSLMRQVRALWRQIWLIGLCLVSGLAAAAIVVAIQTSVYRASMQILVGQRGGTFAPGDTGAVDPSTQTMAALLASDTVASSVISDLGLNLSNQQLLSHLAVTTKPQTAVVGVTYDSTDPAEAVRILRSTGNVFTQLVSPRGASAGGGAVVTARIFDPAHLLPGRVSPTPGRTLALAAVFSLLVGIVLALIRQAVKPRVDSPDQAEEWFGAPVIGTLPNESEHLSPLTAWFGQSAESEPMRLALAPVIAHVQASVGGIIVITSVDGSDGNSRLAAHLGAALASSGEQVVCVEVDHQAPTVTSCLGLADKSPGSRRNMLLEDFGGRVKLQDALRSVRLTLAQNGNGRLVTGRTQGPSDLQLLPSGALWSSGTRAPAAAALVSVATTLSSGSRYIVVDTPPALLFTQMLGLAQASDMILVVAQKGSTTKAQAETIRALLAPAGPEKVGVVLADPPSLLQHLRPPSLRQWRPPVPGRPGEPIGQRGATPRAPVGSGSGTGRRDPAP